MDNVRGHFAAFMAFKTKTNVILLFYFLKLYNFGLNEIFVGSTSSELQQYSTHGSQKSRRKQKKSRKNRFSGSI